MVIISWSGSPHGAGLHSADHARATGPAIPPSSRRLSPSRPRRARKHVPQLARRRPGGAPPDARQRPAWRLPPPGLREPRTSTARGNAPRRSATARQPSFARSGCGRRNPRSDAVMALPRPPSRPVDRAPLRAPSQHRGVHSQSANRLQPRTADPRRRLPMSRAANPIPQCPRPRRPVSTTQREDSEVVLEPQGKEHVPETVQLQPEVVRRLTISEHRLVAPDEVPQELGVD